MRSESVIRMSRLLLAVVVATVFSATCRAQLVTVTPREDADAVLSNPDMGWVLYENYPLDARPGGSSTLVALPDETFPRVDSVALMFAWSDVESRDGQFDFAKVDHAYDHWSKKGKRIQLRMSSESLLWWNHLDPPSGLGVPPHVLERMPAEAKQARTQFGCTYVVVDARDAFYRERLSRFLRAVREHFTGDARPVELIDLRGFGLWGEWHTGFQFGSLNDRRAALRNVIDVWSSAFPDHWVSLSASYDPDSPKELWDGPTKQFDAKFTRTYDAFLRYSAFDHALKKPNVTWRRDGGGGAVHSNERKLIDEAFAARKGPFMSEFVDGYADSLKGGEKWVRWKIDDALSLHPNYVNLLGWQSHDALRFLKEKPELIEHGLRAMGYRLVPTRVTYPAEVREGQRVTIASEWVNRGVGRAMRDFQLRVALVDEADKTAATFDAAALSTGAWVKGETYKASSSFDVEGVAPGTYRLCIALIDPRGAAPINLPLHGRRPDDSYDIGPIRCH